MGFLAVVFNIPVIGITGSVGKTTAKELIAGVLGVKFNTLRTQGNLNNELGVPLTLLSLDETHEVAVIEMGINDFGEMSRLAQMVKPTIFVMTKIVYAHLDNLGDLNGVLKAKTEAFDYMDDDGIAVLNGDDELLRGYDPGRRKILFGCEEHNDVCINDTGWGAIGEFMCIVKVKTDIPGMIEKNLCPDDAFWVDILAYGTHIVELMGAAFAVGLINGLSREEINQGFRMYNPVQGRANMIKTDFIRIIDDCYNANPNSVKAALDTLAEFPGRTVAILGDMLDLGEQSEELHFEIGVYAKKAEIDCLICAGTEADNIYRGYVSTGSGGEAYSLITKSRLISMLPELIKKDDAVLVKASNGMKFNEIVDVLKEM